jgi:ABC-type antimicrobial peptide transport system permease subunit
VLDRKPTPGESLHAHFCYIVSGDYWKTMGIRLLQGRLFTEADGLSKTGLCVVDEAFAKNYWPKGDAIGHRIASINEHRPLTIIGIVNNVLQNELTETKSHGAVYFNYAPEAPNSFHVVVRTALAPSATNLAVRNVLTSIDPEMAMKDFKLMEKRVADTLVARRSPAILAGIFGFTALLLAALGTYGILSYSVAQHQVEIGVRIALGAQPAQIGRHFLNLGVRLLSIGAAIGLLGSWAAGQVMQSALYEYSGFDAKVSLATFVVLTFVSLSACFIPAARATKVDPAECIRA